MIAFRKDFGLWWPDYDHKPEACHARVTRRVRDMDYAIGLRGRAQRRLAIQAGGHAGVWPSYLAKVFDRVYTFEPEPALFRCLCRNTNRNGRRIIPAQMALGASIGTVRMRPHVSAGSWRVTDDGTVAVQQVTIDSLQFSACDLIVLDVEGYEVEALKGAHYTIAAYQPVLHVEELDRSKDAIRDHMKSIGYKLVKEINNDAVYIPG